MLALIGANGAGKRTLLKAIVGLIRVEPQMVRYRGEPIGGLPAPEIVKRGIALVPEGRRLFPSLSVEENLLIGGQLGRKGPWSLETVYRLFPVLDGAPQRALDLALRRPAADGGDRAGADVQPRPDPLRRDQPRPRADRHPRHLCRAPGRHRRAAPAPSSSSRTSPGRFRWRAASSACRRAGVALAGAAGGLYRARTSPPPISEPEAWTGSNAVLQGVLLGGLYALFAAGLSLIFGVMRLVNIAHGDLIVLAAFMALSSCRRPASTRS